MKKIPKAKYSQIVKDYESGLTLEKVGKRYSVCLKSIQNILKKEGIKRRAAKKKPTRTIERDGKIYRICNKCEDEKIIEDFYRCNKANNIYKRRYVCKSCTNDKKHEREYGITIEERRQLFKEYVEEHGNVCEICNEPETRTLHGKIKNLCLDHNHSINGKEGIRGFICHHCNCGLGSAKDTIETLKYTVAYLEKMNTLEGRPLYAFDGRRNRKAIKNLEDLLGTPSKSMLRKALKNYGITKTQLFKILLDQSCCCAICAKKLEIGNRSCSIDHDHANERTQFSVRGCLCLNCNFLLGMFKENIETIKNAIKYLEKYSINS